MDLKKHLYVRNEEEWNPLCQRTYLSNKELVVQHVENAIVLPPRKIPGQVMDIFEGGVCDANLNFIAGSIRISAENPGYMSVMRSYQVPSENIEAKKEHVIYGGVVFGQFGHFMLESLCRFWYFLQNPKDQRRIILLNFWGWHAWMDEFLSLFPVPSSRFLVVRKPTQFLSVTIPEESIHCWGGIYTKEYLLPYKAIRNNIRKRKEKKNEIYKKIYLSRSHYNDDKICCCNEEYFENYFQSKGFHIIKPEQHSVYDQIHWAMEADEIAGILGTLTHFALFCKPGTKFIMLTRVDTEPLLPQCIVNEVSKVEWYLVDVSTNFLFGLRNVGVTLMGASTSWKKFALEYFGDSVTDNTVKDACYDYMVRWCQWAVKPDILAYLDRLDYVSLFRQFYRNIVGTEPPASCLESSPKDASMQTMQKRISDLERKLASSEHLLKIYQQKNKMIPCTQYETKTMQDGWSPSCYQGQDCGGKDGKYPLTGIRLNITTENIFCSYQIYHPKSGWSRIFSAGEEALDEAGHMPLYGMKILLDEESAKKYDIVYQLHNPLNGWSPEAHHGDGISIDTIPMNLIRIQLVERKK